MVGAESWVDVRIITHGRDLHEPDPELAVTRRAVQSLECPRGVAAAPAHPSRGADQRAAVAIAWRSRRGAGDPGRFWDAVARVSHTPDARPICARGGPCIRGPVLRSASAEGEGEGPYAGIKAEHEPVTAPLG